MWFCSTTNGVRLALLIITLLGAGLRVRQVSESLWLDELHTGWTIAGNSQELTARAQSGNQSPCYFYFERACDQLSRFVLRTVGGDQLPYANEWSLRALSLIAGIALPWASYQLARQFAIPPCVALLAPLLAALDPQFVFYAQEARCYALVQLVAVIHATLSLRRLPDHQQNNERDRIHDPNAHQARITLTQRFAWILSATLLFYLHYLTILLLASSLLVLLVSQWRASQRLQRGGKLSGQTAVSHSALRALVVDAVVFLIAGSWAYGHVATVAARRQNWLRFLASTPWHDIFDWTTYLVTPLFTLTLFAIVAWIRSRSSPAAPAITLTSSASDRYSLALNSLAPNSLIYLSACTLLPLLVASGASGLSLGPPLLYRYLISSASLLPIWPTVVMALSPSSRGRLLIGVATAGLMIAHSPPTRELLLGQPPSAQRGEDWRGLCLSLNQSWQPITPAERRPLVLLCPSLVEDWQLPQGSKTLVEFCQFPLRSRYPLDIDTDFIWPLPTIDEPRLNAAQIAQIRTRLRQDQPVILIVRGDALLANQIENELRSVIAQPQVPLVATRDERFAGLVVLTWQEEKSAAR